VTTMERCPVCGGASPMRADTCEERREIAGVLFSAPVACDACTICGEKFVGFEALARFELEAAAALALRGRRTGSALRFMRSALGYRSAELAGLLDVAPETFSRWETGDREPDARAFALVGSLATDRLNGGNHTLAMLRAMREPARIEPGETVRLERVDRRWVNSGER